MSALTVTVIGSVRMLPHALAARFHAARAGALLARPAPGTMTMGVASALALASRATPAHRTASLFNDVMMLLSRIRVRRHFAIVEPAQPWKMLRKSGQRENMSAQPTSFGCLGSDNRRRCARSGFPPTAEYGMA